MRLRPHMTFRGNCEEAFKAHERILGGKMTVMLPWGAVTGGGGRAGRLERRWSTRPWFSVTRSWRVSTFHRNNMSGPRGLLTVLLSVQTQAEGKRIFDELAAGGLVQMPFQKTFWSSGFGALVDRFGTPWEVTVEQPSG